ncbi:hypothetical protein [Dokdonia sp.]
MKNLYDNISTSKVNEYAFANLPRRQAEAYSSLSLLWNGIYKIDILHLL